MWNKSFNIQTTLFHTQSLKSNVNSKDIALDTNVEQ